MSSVLALWSQCLWSLHIHVMPSADHDFKLHVQTNDFTFSMEFNKENKSFATMKHKQIKSDDNFVPTSWEPK